MSQSRRPSGVVSPARVMLVVSLSVGLATGVSLGAQQTPASNQVPLGAPPVLSYGGDVSSVQRTAAERYVGALMSQREIRVSVPVGTSAYPKDSIAAAVTAKALDELTKLQQAPVTGIQQEPYGQVAAMAGNVPLARQQFDARLAAPLSADDHLYALSTAVNAFINVDHPDQLPVAQEYLARLDTMGGFAPIKSYAAHVDLGNAYYQLGQPTQVLTEGQKALAALARAPFLYHGAMLNTEASLEFYLALIEAVMAGPDPNGHMAPIFAELRGACRAPQSLLASDSLAARGGEARCTSYAERIIGLSAMLAARTTPPIQGSRWVNVPQTEAHDLALNDGTVRVLIFGRSTFADMIMAANHLQHRLPAGAEVVFVTATQGFWGGDFLEPDQEVQRLVNYYTKDLKVTVPIAIWASEKMTTPSGGHVPARSPNNTAYQTTTGFLSVVVDAKGHIRRIGTFYSQRDEESTLALVNFLVTQAHQASPSATPATSGTSPAPTPAPASSSVSSSSAP